MKKTIVLLLSFMMVLTFALASCGGGGDADLSDSKYIGTWKAESLSLGEESGDLEGGDYVLTLNGDGTGTFTSTNEDGTEEASDITWSLTNDGFKTTGDTKMKFSDDGDGIKTKILGVEVHFVRMEEGAESGEPEVDGTAYGYGGSDPVEAAVYKYMAEEVSKNYDKADTSIPTVSIISTDNSNPDDVLVYGDFWIDNYNINGDTLECVSGGNYPGVMHVNQNYEVTAFDQVADGADFEQSAKELFGDQYDAFMSVYGDDAARAELRKLTVSDYVKFNGLEVTKYQDYGWDPVDLVLE